MMVRTPRQDLEQGLRDPEFAKLYGAAQAKSAFAVVLARTRRDLGMSQRELADGLGRSQPYIAKLEGGDANPTLGTVGSLLATVGLRLAIQTQPLLPRPVVPPDTSAQYLGTVRAWNDKVVTSADDGMIPCAGTASAGPTAPSYVGAGASVA